MRWLASGMGGVVLAGMTACGGGPEVDTSRCTFERQEGLCEATVTLDPRESESQDEATTLEVRWEWLGRDPAEVPDRVVRQYLKARDAVALASSIDKLGKSRCAVEVGIGPAACVGVKRITAVEADP
ncbi:MAG: hypothetical protein JNJ59_15080 [Deltaproteobacteria bacterium]|nr:hypothetical protein [Deltaproteobacteria bacterium]